MVPRQVSILGLTAMGAAIFRRWRALDLFAFVGTVVIYQLWHMEYYARDQMTPALIFTTLFYLMYLLTPALNSLVRRTPATVDGLALITANALWSFTSYYRILFDDHRHLEALADLFDLGQQIGKTGISFRL